MTSALFKAGAALALSALLAACGGGSGGGDPAGASGSGESGNTLPQSALASSAALVDYLKSLVATPSETATPVYLGSATLPTDDTGPPAAL